ncbi:hypothetical protein N7478_000617 [Penicillium angulare]|uniref:uncharacterized protein n=1 Tax=Penicillium angulare TaxID=116970 RepID=UPI002541A91F|nr:uncharacterized protein N7478_000617 [Penicillium angulare]KAJ5291366.1 hypothetical protein N7478_000617 [Penicillium angulare]
MLPHRGEASPVRQARSPSREREYRYYDREADSSETDVESNRHRRRSQGESRRIINTLRGSGVPKAMTREKIPSRVRRLKGGEPTVDKRVPVSSYFEEPGGPEEEFEVPPAGALRPKVYTAAPAHSPGRRLRKFNDESEQFAHDSGFNGSTRLDAQCGQCGGDDDEELSTLETQALQKRIKFLEAKLKKLDAHQGPVEASKHETIYRLHEEDSESLFLDAPDILRTNSGEVHLRCSVPLDNFQLHLALNPNISFVVFQDYQKRPQPESSSTNTKKGKNRISPFSESIHPVSTDLKMALNTLLHSKDEFKSITEDYRYTKELESPYIFIYHMRDQLPAIKDKMPAASQRQLAQFLGYVDQAVGSQYKAADALLTSGEILPKFINYLFKPGDIVIERDDKGYVGYVARSWLKNTSPDGDVPSSDILDGSFDDDFPAVPYKKDSKMKLSWTTKAWTWGFTGTFYRRSSDLELRMPLPHDEDQIGCRSTEERGDSRLKGFPITSLNVFPLKYAAKEVLDMLQRRGETFWKCRNRRLVSYKATDEDQFSDMTDDRYMIDTKTYGVLHSIVALFYGSNNRLDADAMASDSPPDDQFKYLVPPTIKGYNLRRKKWFDLATDRISDAVWNHEAFSSLVIERKSKDLIQALVSSQLESEKATDLIAGKGNGLILLLHGAPGTGKTLTAESVAEIAEKPLYRVTCGDVGTKAEDVEKYLESVLYLGRIWGCVVLLDEADIFLEQRSLEDLQRNALVSVFLRVLEYYDGILILTSNRVGTFDEAFRSRIQLALHYPNLGPQQRLRIWQIFIDRLENMDGEAIDIVDLRDNLHSLKDEELNGRQIRNVITTARQYARWKKTTLTYEHLKDVIQVSGRFDTYLDKIHGGFNQEDLARDDGIR